MEYYISRAGFANLQQKKKKILETIEFRQQQIGASVKLDNDLRENPEFISLRTELTYVLPRRLSEIEQVLGFCRIIEEMSGLKDSEFDKVQLGARVGILYEDGTTVTYLILGYEETDIDNDIISYLSPIAQSLLGKGVGDYAEINTPGGVIRVKITSVERGL